MVLHRLRAKVGWCGSYDDNDFSQTKCAVHVAAVANRVCRASTDSGTSDRTYDGTNAIATARENTNSGAKDPYYGDCTAYAANV